MLGTIKRSSSGGPHLSHIRRDSTLRSTSFFCSTRQQDNFDCVRATKFEFERRFWIIFAIYAAGFSLSNVDHVRAITAKRTLAAGGADDERFRPLEEIGDDLARHLEDDGAAAAVYG